MKNAGIAMYGAKEWGGNKWQLYSPALNTDVCDRIQKPDYPAEGVETEERAELPEALGCQEMQGYLFGRPLPSREFGKLLALAAY